MKLSKQERIAALIIIAIVILAVGAFMLVKPKFEEASRTKETLAQRQGELDAAKERQKLKDPLRKDIEKEYEEGEHLADMFFPELASYQADNAFRDFIKQLDFPVVVEEVEVAEPTTDTLSVSFFTPTEVSYALKTYVTQGVEMTEEESKLAQRNAILQQALSSEQTIGASQISFKASVLSRADYLRLIDAINDYEIESEDGKIRKAICIDTAEFDYDDVNQFYDFMADLSTEEIAREGRAILRELGISIKDETPNAQEPNMDGIKLYYIHNITGSIVFYSIERMQDPQAQLNAQDGKAA